MEQSSRGAVRRRSVELRSLTEGVGSLIFAKNTGRYLFLLRATRSWNMTWGLPGGKINPNEGIQQGLCREILEELGGEIISPKFIHVETFTSNNKKFTYHTYFVAVDFEFVPELNSEHIGYAWLPLSAAPRPLHPGVSRTLASAEATNKILDSEKNFNDLS